VTVFAPAPAPVPSAADVGWRYEAPNRSASAASYGMPSSMKV
jgi:hypothetical protein